MKEIFLNSILWNRSLVDGPGVRTVVFLQGCDLHCEGCQNPATWEIGAGTKISVESLVKMLKNNTLNKKITISGGEPLVQADAVVELLDQLKEFDVVLYTGHSIQEVPPAILERIKYIKTGTFQKDKKTTLMPYIGSTNQKFRRIKLA